MRDFEKTGAASPRDNGGSGIKNFCYCIQFFRLFWLAKGGVVCYNEINKQ